ncbi:FxSxx-COOH cyclophane-containing RiPP peptide [Nocardia brevicatena]|uniref:FxSxx-COOH cyclophane-containing RiPP peptide n=1 Tax=Nocardia brevicatena TaxID=37327 RepID=UPI00030C4B05|nr:FxSxx-COOH cyclophane-containing RiPP peptide [Nocardia brevicatena]
MGNPTEFADLDPQQLAAVENPALRAALERHLAQSEGPRAFGFQSFIDAGE